MNHESRLIEIFHSHKNGFTLIEIVIVITLLSSLVSLLTASIAIVPLLRKANYRTRAHALLAAELSRIRAMPFSAITNKTSARFIGVLFNRGEWQIRTNNPQSLPNVLSLVNPRDPSIDPITGILKIPVGEIDDFTLQTQIRIDTSSPNGWQAGIIFRARDNENFYEALLRNNRFILEKNSGGALTQLVSTSLIVNPGTWYLLDIRANGGTLEARINGALVGSTTDISFTQGFVGFISRNGAYISIDDVTLTTTQALQWNFDTDAPNQLGAAWHDFGVYELPNGIDFLTVFDYQGNPAIKDVTARIDWRDTAVTGTATLETLLSQ